MSMMSYTLMGSRPFSHWYLAFLWSPCFLGGGPCPSLYRVFRSCYSRRFVSIVLLLLFQCRRAANLHVAHLRLVLCRLLQTLLGDVNTVCRAQLRLPCCVFCELCFLLLVDLDRPSRTSRLRCLVFQRCGPFSGACQRHTALCSRHVFDVCKEVPREYVFLSLLFFTLPYFRSVGDRPSRHCLLSVLSVCAKQSSVSSFHLYVPSNVGGAIGFALCSV